MTKFYYSDECLCWRHIRLHWREAGGKNLMSSNEFPLRTLKYSQIIKVVRDVILYTHVSFTQLFFSSHISHIHFRLRNNCIRKKNVFIYQQICAVDCCCYFSISIISFEVCLFVVAILMRTSNSDFFFLDEWICEFVYARIKLSKCLNMLMLSKQMCFDI